MQWLILSFSVIWEVDIQDDDENEEKNMTKIYVQRNSDRELLGDYNFCEKGIMCEVHDLKEELGSAWLQAEGIRCVWEATVI